MKLVWNVIFALVFFLPGISLAEDVAVPQDSVVNGIVADSDSKKPSVFLIPYDVTIGYGTRMLVFGIDWVFFKHNMIYESKRPETMEKAWMPTNEFWWTIRSNIYYDFGRDEFGFLFQPNIHYLLKGIVVMASVGPEVGWSFETGFDYGVSARIGTLAFFSTEIGYLVNAKKIYVNWLFNLPIVPLDEVEYHSYN